MSRRRLSPLEKDRSEVFVTGGNGHGSTNTAVRRFTNIEINRGKAISYVDSATLGGSFTINRTGYYALSYADKKTTGTCSFAIVVNAAVLTDVTNASNDTLRLIFGNTGGTVQFNGTAVAFLKAGDVVRGMTDTSAQDTSRQAVGFRVCYLGPGLF